MRFAQCIIAALLLVWGNASAQPDTLWTRSYRLQSNPVCHRLVPTSDGGFALGVQTDNNYNNDWGLIKVDSTGRREWSRIYHSEDTLGALHDILYGFSVAPDGGFYMAGQWNLEFAQLMRVNGRGEVIWSGGFPIYDYDQFFSMTTDREGNAVCGGTTAGENGGIHGWLEKINPDGEFVWQRVYGGRGTDVFLRVICASDSGFMAVGWTTSYGGMKAYAVKTDADGNQEWARTFNANRENHAFLSVVESPDGGYLAVGSGRINDYHRFYWVRISSNGDSLWSGSWHTNDEASEQALDVINSPNGGFLVVGKSYEIEYLALRLDSDGEILWRFDAGHYPNTETIESVLTLEDGGYLLGGRKGNPPISTDVWLIRTKPDPEFNSVRLLDPAFPFLIALEPPYPNPFNATTTIRYSVGARHAVPLRLAIYGLDGRIVAELFDGRWKMEKGTSHSISWNAAGFPAGEYFVRLQSGQETAVRKVVLVK